MKIKQVLALLAASSVAFGAIACGDDDSNSNSIKEPSAKFDKIEKTVLDQCKATNNDLDEICDEVQQSRTLGFCLDEAADFIQALMDDAEDDSINKTNEKYENCIESTVLKWKKNGNLSALDSDAPSWAEGCEHLAKCRKGIELDAVDESRFVGCLLEVYTKIASIDTKYASCASTYRSAYKKFFPCQSALTCSEIKAGDENEANIACDALFDEADACIDKYKD